MAATSLPPSRCLSPPFRRHRELKHFPVKSQSFKDDGKSANNYNIVDANLGVMRERISLVKFKERLERCSRNKKDGWDYQQFGYDPNLRKEAMVAVSRELVGLVSGALVFVFLSGSLFICLVSLLVHLLSV